MMLHWERIVPIQAAATACTADGSLLKKKVPQDYLFDALFASFAWGPTAKAPGCPKAGAGHGNHRTPAEMPALTRKRKVSSTCKQHQHQRQGINCPCFNRSNGPCGSELGSR